MPGQHDLPRWNFLPVTRGMKRRSIDPNTSRKFDYLPDVTLVALIRSIPYLISALPLQHGMLTAPISGQIFTVCEFETPNEWRWRPKACKKSTAAARPRRLSLLVIRRSSPKSLTGSSRSAVAWAIPSGIA